MTSREQWRWRKSSLCSNRDCVEVAAGEGAVLIRRTVDGNPGAVLEFSVPEWQVFTDALRRGEFDDLAAGSGSGPTESQ
ncbi:DUF397 domain-containing protein [Kineosporia mesophila]|uniref:DUF397 domain-containing protein n=1 Tax=Kineosporia mesophila TaxID=566012 RepID=UPI0031E5F061